MNEATWQWNTALFETIHATGGSPEWLLRAARVLADAPLAAAGLVALWIVWRQDDAGIAVRIVIACVLVAGTEALVRLYASQPRPFAAGMSVEWVAHAANNAMPSTHVALAWGAAAVTLIGRHARMAAVLLVLGGAMAWARMYVGLQWPADIAVSALCACLAAAGSVGVERGVGSFVRAYSRGSAGGSSGS